MSDGERKRKKARYDKNYRKVNRLRLKAEKAAYFQSTYDPIRAAKIRKKRMPYHVAYCRQPWYRAWKKAYDSERRARRFGAFADTYRVLRQLVAEVKRQMPDRFERYAQAGRQQWNPINQERRRRKTYERFDESFGC